MNYTIMDVDVLEVASVARSHPFLTSSLVVLFTTPLFHLVLFFSPLLISTALCVVALVSIGPQIEKIREERERQFKLLGLSLPGVESERPPSRYLIFRRGRHRPPQGQGRGERWSNWVRGMEIRGQSIWLSSGSQLMSDIAEENLKVDFGTTSEGIQMINEDFSPGGALMLGRAEDDLVSSRSFQTVMQPFYDQICGSLVSYNPEEFVQTDARNIRNVRLEKTGAASSELQRGSKACEKAFAITEEDMTSCQDNGLAVDKVWDQVYKCSSVLQQDGWGEELGAEVNRLQFLKAGTFYPAASTSSSYEDDITNKDWQRIAVYPTEADVRRIFELNVRESYTKQAKLVVSQEPLDHLDHQNSVCPEPNEDKEPFSLCGCFKRRKLFCFSKTSREIRSKQKEQKSCV